MAEPERDLAWFLDRIPDDLPLDAAPLTAGEMSRQSIEAFIAARIPKETTVPDPTEPAQCGALPLGPVAGTHIGPCVLASGHDGPVHRDANDVQWAGLVGRPPEPQQDVPDELVQVGVDAWQASGRVFMDRATHAILAAVLPVYERMLRARIAAEYRAASAQTQADSGVGLEPLAEALARDCRVDDVAPAVFDDARNIAFVAYRHLADRLEGETP